jgi:hypothetical protein
MNRQEIVARPNAMSTRPASSEAGNAAPIGWRDPTATHLRGHPVWGVEGHLLAVGIEADHDFSLPALLSSGSRRSSRIFP